MEEELLKIIYNELVNVLGLNYEYMEWTGELVYPYITGEHYTNFFDIATGRLEGELLLEIWNRGKEIDLVKIHDKIQLHFEKIVKMQNNMGFCIAYKNKNSDRTGDMDLKKIQIRLETYCWKGE
ncbi:MAG: hypothetical protein MJ231_07335 [bacterium]|nr:hypothetical protein [bacterium]